MGLIIVMGQSKIWAVVSKRTLKEIWQIIIQIYFSVD